MKTAIVIGLSSHGLALCRALKSNQVKVYALESNLALPATKTNTAEIIHAENINTDELIDSLLTLLKRIVISDDEKPVIFPTNDKMVRVIANSWPKLSEFFSLSWGDNTDLVLTLQSKEKIQYICEKEGLLYPKSAVLNSVADIEAVLSNFDLPALIKPVNPMSSFKVMMINNRHDLEQLFVEHSSALPFLLQQWIDGSDEQLVFCSMFLVDGKPKVYFTGQKLASFPPGMGQGTIMGPMRDDVLFKLSSRFFENTGYTGPASLEFKVDSNNRYWVIEPNIGRTEYCVQCVLSNGIDLVGIEHSFASGRPFECPEQAHDYNWFDTERDVFCYLEKVCKNKSLYVNGNKPVFPFYEPSDLMPFYNAMALTLQRMFRKVKKILNFDSGIKKSVPEDYSSQIYSNIEELKHEFAALGSIETVKKVFLSYSWFDTFLRYVSVQEECNVVIICLFNKDRNPIAILPLFDSEQHSRHNSLHAIANYYSPIFDLVFDEEKISRVDAINYIFQLNLEVFKSIGSLNMSPVYQSVVDDFSIGLRSSWFRPFVHKKSVNWHTNFVDFNTFKNNLSSKVKNTYRRKLKKLNTNSNWEFDYVSGSGEVDKALAEYNAVYLKSWKKSEPSPDFIRNLTMSLAQDGCVRLGILRVESKPVAAQIWMTKDGSAFIYKLAYDQDYSDYSVGTILTYKMCERCIIKESVTTIDFLTGDDSFKEQWMTNQRDLLEIQWVNLLSYAGCLLYVRNKLSRLKKRILKLQDINAV